MGPRRLGSTLQRPSGRLADGRERIVSAATRDWHPGRVLPSSASSLRAEIPLQVEADSAHIKQADSFVVKIVAGPESDTIADLYGIGFQLRFDPASLEAAEAARDSFWGSRMVLEFSHIDNEQGIAALSVTLLESPGLSGHGSVARFLVKARLGATLGPEEGAGTGPVFPPSLAVAPNPSSPGAYFVRLLGSSTPAECRITLVR